MNKEKTLSQQLCELCALEYEKKTSYMEIKDPLYNQSIGTLKEETRKFDFENPENFVKLLELRILTGCHLWGYLSLKGLYLSHRQGFLKTLILYLEQNFSDAEPIKQSIRDYDGWVWG